MLQIFPDRSECETSMPRSITATTTPGLPVYPRAQASPAWLPYGFAGVVASPAMPHSEPSTMYGSLATTSGKYRKFGSANAR